VLPDTKRNTLKASTEKRWGVLPPQSTRGLEGGGTGEPQR